MSAVSNVDARPNTTGYRGIHTIPRERAAEAKLEKGERLTHEEWNSGDRVWLVELISPFANKNNKISEAMLLDLMQGPFKHTAFHLHRTDPATGRRDKIRVANHLQAPAAS